MISDQEIFQVLVQSSSQRPSASVQGKEADSRFFRLTADRWRLTKRLTAVRGRHSRADRAIRTGSLNALLRVYVRPINVMVCHGPSGITPWETWF
jgi:hypothetical protein